MYVMKTIHWNIDKAKWLREHSDRNRVGFEECAVVIEAGQQLDMIDNPSANFPNQKAFVIEIEEYVYLVPFVATDEEIFLKTVYPSPNQTALYLGNKTP
jgi:hypothetical protein